VLLAIGSLIPIGDVDGGVCDRSLDEPEDWIGMKFDILDMLLSPVIFFAFNYI
jgi:hypothetical protein